MSKPAEIILAFGATGTGKTAGLKQTLASWAPDRFVAIDPMREFSDQAPPVASLAELAQQMAGETWRVSYRPAGDRDLAQREFSVVCRLAAHHGRCVLLVDELADFVRAGWAPAGWFDAVRKGRHAGLRILCASQRPADIDKGVLGNATLIRTGRLNSAADVATVAAILDVPADEIRRLPPLAYIERDMSGAGETRRGVLTF